MLQRNFLVGMVGLVIALGLMVTLPGQVSSQQPAHNLAIEFSANGTAVNWAPPAWAALRLNAVLVVRNIGTSNWSSTEQYAAGARRQSYILLANAKGVADVYQAIPNINLAPGSSTNVSLTQYLGHYSAWTPGATPGSLTVNAYIIDKGQVAAQTQTTVTIPAHP